VRRGLGFTSFGRRQSVVWMRDRRSGGAQDDVCLFDGRGVISEGPMVICRIPEIRFAAVVSAKADCVQL
jgi:hypothetical protein